MGPDKHHRWDRRLTVVLEFASNPEMHKGFLDS